MWSKTSIIWSLTLILGNVICQDVVSYKGYKLYDIITKNLNQTNILHDLSVNDFLGLDFLSFTREPEGHSRVVVPPFDNEQFENILQQYKIEYRLLIDDLSKSIEAERKENRQLKTRTAGKISFTKYNSAYEINAYLDYLQMKHPQIVYVKTVGKSYEGRNLKMIKISQNVKNSNKKILFIDSGIHAREWLSSATALYIIYQLVEKYENNKDLLQKTDIVIMPLLNPDGYEYTHKYNRLWRKTRKPNVYCVGADGNRNFDFHWGEIGVSPYECDEIYPGQHAFSESETRTLRDVLYSLKDRTKMYLSLHSYGSYILYPWGWTRTRPNTWNHINDIALAGAQAISQATKGQYRFKCGSQTEVLYPASGGSHDYALGVLEIPISMTMELPYAGDGFHPFPSQIRQLVDAIWPGIKSMIKTLDTKFP